MPAEHLHLIQVLDDATNIAAAGLDAASGRGEEDARPGHRLGRRRDVAGGKTAAANDRV